MVRYTLAQNPELILNVPGRDSIKAREKAMDQLIEILDSGELNTELADGFGPKDFIEVKEPETTNTDEEDAITQAVQILSNLATLKLKVQESREAALKIRATIDILFTDDTVSEDEITQLKEGFKLLKNFALINMRYREAKTQAESARQILDEALKSAHPETKPKK